MTLAEIREAIRHEIVVHALAGSAGRVDAMVLRVGRPLVLQHVQPRQRIRWSGYLYLDCTLEVERVEKTQVLFHSPRIVLRMVHFLGAVVRGDARDEDDA